MSENGIRFYEFGPFRLDATERQLWRDGDEITVTPKAFGVLLTLVRNHGHIVEKETFMREVWTESFVEEKNLTDNISILRQALIDDPKEPRYIKTVPRRGYRFVGDVIEVRDAEVEMLIAERTRASVVIEEETSDPPATRAALVSQSTGWLTRRGKPLILTAIALTVIGGSAVALWRGLLKNSSRNNERRAGDLAHEMKITRLTNSGVVGTAAISPDGKFVVYTEAYTSGKGTLYVKQTGTNNEVQLLEPGQRFFGGTAFSPDGSFIYYVAYEKDDSKGALYRIPVLGGPTTRLIGNFDSQFTLSPDGRQVTFYRADADGKHEHIMIASLDTGDERSLLSHATSETILSGIPAWSPDGLQIAFAAAEAHQRSETEGGVHLFAAAVDGHGVKQLSNEHFVEIGKMNWMPDGKGLVFVALRPRLPNQFYYLSYPSGEVRRITNDLLTYGNYGLGITADQSAMVVDIWEDAAQLWIVDAAGAGNSRQLTLGSDDGARGLSSLPDGRVIYVARTGDEHDIWTVKPDGTEAKPLTADSFSPGDMSATPDGRYLFFVSDRAGGNHLFRLNQDGSGLKQLTFGNTSDSAPDCSPDGKWVAYAATVNGKTTLWRVAVEGGAPSQLTDYESVAPSFSPDGQMLSCILPTESKMKQASIAIISAEGGAPLKTFEILVFAFYYHGARWTPDGQALVFLRTENNVMNLWQQPLNGSPAQPLTNFKSDSIYNYSYTRDGKGIILARGKVIVNVAMIKHFL
jgi:Tol biopolymer transport system component/DNA-binding winged helix-turn-helix (wHTH) protein